MIQALTSRVSTSGIAPWNWAFRPKTVSRALNRGGAPKRGRRRRGGEFERYTPKVDRLLAEAVSNGVVIAREIRAEGYDGGITVVNDYIRPKRALRPSLRGASRSLHAAVECR